MNADTILAALNNTVECCRHYDNVEMETKLGYCPSFINVDYPLLDYRNHVGKSGMRVATAKIGLEKARLLREFDWALVCQR